MCEDNKGCAKQAEGESLLSRVERLERDLIERKYPKPKFFPGDSVIYTPYGKDCKTKIETEIISVSHQFRNDFFHWVYTMYIFENIVKVPEHYLLPND